MLPREISTQTLAPRLWQTSLSTTASSALRTLGRRSTSSTFALAVIVVLVSAHCVFNGLVYRRFERVVGSQHGVRKLRVGLGRPRVGSLALDPLLDGPSLVGMPVRRHDGVAHQFVANRAQKGGAVGRHVLRCFAPPHFAPHAATLPEVDSASIFSGLQGEVERSLVLVDQVADESEDWCNG